MPNVTVVNPSNGDIMLRFPERFEKRYQTIPPLSTTTFSVNDSELPIIQAELQSVSGKGVTFTTDSSVNNPSKTVRAASTANVTTLSGAQTIDAVALVEGDRVLLKNQTTASQNGIYVVHTGAWTRATDADTGAKFGGATLIAISEGTTNGNSLWMNTTDGAVVIGTTALTFVKVSA